MDKKWLKESKGGELSQGEKEGIITFIGKFITYIVFLVLYGVAFMNISYWSNYIAFICIFCIHVITGLYILKDIFTNKEIQSKMSSNLPFGFTTDNGLILIVFLIILVVAFIFKFISMAIMLAVFEYGRYQTPNNNYNTYVLSQENRDLVNNYKSSYKRTTLLFLLLAFFLILPRFSKETQTIILNSVCILISITILIMTIIEVVSASTFLKIKQRHQNLYVTKPNSVDPSKMEVISS